MIGPKLLTEDADDILNYIVVEERCVLSGSVWGTVCGLYTSEDADISNEKQGENPCHRNPKDSRGRFVRPGLVGT